MPLANPSDATTIDATQARAVLRLGRELRELRDPGAWRAHLAQTLAVLIGARVVLVAEVQGDHAPHVVEHGLDDADRGPFIAGARDLHVSPEALERLRPIMISNAAAPNHGVISSIKLFRGPHEARFSARDRLLLELVHEDLAAEWRARPAPPRLTPRQRQVLAFLTDGASEKQIAGALDMSLHTTHDHVKAVYRAFAVHSRGELLARVADVHGARPRAQLWVETAGLRG